MWFASKSGANRHVSRRNGLRHSRRDIRMEINIIIISEIEGAYSSSVMPTIV